MKKNVEDNTSCSLPYYFWSLVLAKVELQLFSSRTNCQKKTSKAKLTIWRQRVWTDSWVQGKNLKGRAGSSSRRPPNQAELHRWNALGMMPKPKCV